MISFQQKRSLPDIFGLGGTLASSCFLGQRPLVPLLLLGPPFFPIILFGSTTLFTGTGISLHMQWLLTSQSHGSFSQKRTIGFSLQIKLHALIRLGASPPTLRLIYIKWSSCFFGYWDRLTLHNFLPKLVDSG
jgi:hypothetical protein